MLPYSGCMQNNHKNKARQAFAERFCTALDESGYSTNQLQELQELFSVSSQAVRKWISGQSLPTSARIPKIAELLGVRRAWLQDGELPMRPMMRKVSENGASYLDEETISAEEMELIVNFRSLNLKQRNAIKQTISIFLNKK